MAKKEEKKKQNSPWKLIWSIIPLITLLFSIRNGADVEDIGAVKMFLIARDLLGLGPMGDLVMLGLVLSIVTVLGKSSEK